MATWLICKLGINSLVKVLLIITAWLLAASYVLYETKINAIQLGILLTTIHQVVAYIVVILLIYHLQILNKNTINLAQRFDRKKELRIRKGTVTLKINKSTDLETQVLIRHFRSRSETGREENYDDEYVIV